MLGYLCFLSLVELGLRSIAGSGGGEGGEDGRGHSRAVVADDAGHKKGDRVPKMNMGLLVLNKSSRGRGCARRLLTNLRGCAHGVHGQEGAPRRGGGPRGRPLHHFLAPDGATYVLYIYFGLGLS